MSAQSTVALVRVGYWKRKAGEYVRDALSTTAFSKIENLSIGLVWFGLVCGTNSRTRVGTTVIK
jgi:hypothetical protein